MDRATKAIALKADMALLMFGQREMWAAYMSGVHEGVEIGAREPELAREMYENMEALEKLRLGDRYEPPEPGWSEFMEEVNGP